MGTYSAMVTINGVLETNPAYQVKPKDEVLFDDQRIRIETKTRIIAFNKPEGYITTMKDPLRRKTVIDLIQTDERLFPIGRLDKPSSGDAFVLNQHIASLSYKKAAELRNYNIGFIFQVFNLLPVYTVFENVEFAFLSLRNCCFGGCLPAEEMGW